MVFQRQTTLSDLSDFVIERLKKEFGLWFELTAGYMGIREFACADLRDGASCLQVDFGLEQFPRECEH